MIKPVYRRFTTAFLSAALLAAGLLQVGPAQAQEDVQKIAAVVNDEIISDYDVDQRLGLIIATTGEVDSPEEYQQMRENVLELLIDEKLQIQEARELEIPIPNEAIEQRYAEIAARNNITPQQFDASLEQMGADKSVVISQLYASYAWEEVIAARLRPLLTIPES
ncbi:MAG: SurA N-terminal domain-containing protein, partial [Alphaproteobacteria bacterium]|nr:SurA N-terminal domain-containing protein [Alphaproteobacteria bacterium]